MEDSEVKVTLEDFLKLKYELTYSLKELTCNVTRLSNTVEKGFETLNDKVDSQTVLLGSKGGKTQEDKVPSSSLPSNIKWLLVIILGIAFLGALGAAIGINLIDKVPLS